MSSPSRIVILSNAKDLLFVGAAAIVCTAVVAGCKPTPPPTSPTQLAKPIAQYPTRPTTPPPTFKLFHQNPTSITLVVPETTTDTQLAALLYQLRDAANTHTFNTLHLPQALIDKRDPKLWFHIYRSPKCAAEKYASGPPPCGGSYHAAADFTLGSFKDPNRTEGVILHDETHQTALWNPGTP